MTTMHPAGDQLAAAAEDRALALACAVHDTDLNEVDRLTHRLKRDELVALAVVCAAMVDIDKTKADLLAWTEPRVTWTRRRMLDAHAAFVRGERNHWACDGERAYQRSRRSRKAA